MKNPDRTLPHAKFLLFILMLTAYGIPLLAEGDGYGENPGGAGGDTIIVDNANDLKSLAGSSTPYVLLIKDTIDVGSEVRVRSYKTISGLNSSSTIIGDINISGGTHDVVIKNLNITNPANDGITIREARYVYVTNCTVYDCADGCIDVTVESDFVTISYCRFYYDQVTFHKFVNLIGADDSNITDRGKLHVTMHHNWWDTGCTSRMPRVRFGRVHVYNNYFSCVGNNYANRAALEAQILSEYNYFEGVRDPLAVEGGEARSQGNIYDSCEGTVYEGTDDVFTASYNYTTVSAEDARSEVIEKAGNENRDSVLTNQKKETIINWNDLDPITFGTPLDETRLNASANGNTGSPIYSHPIGSQLPEGYNTITVSFPEDDNYKAASKTVNIRVNYEYFALRINITDGVDSGLVTVFPEGNLVEGERLYPKGTEVTLTASSNPVSDFEHWNDNYNDTAITITMDQDVQVSANYKQLDYIVAWDFFMDGDDIRQPDLFATEDNRNATFSLLKEDNASYTWTLFSGDNLLFGKNAAMIRKGRSSAGDYFFAIRFDAGHYRNIRLTAEMLGFSAYYVNQNVEYSTDGITYYKVGEFNLNEDSVWYANEFYLPEAANRRDSVFVRFIADKSSELITNGSILGASISNIYVYADNVTYDQIQTFVAGRKIDKVIYYSVDGKANPHPVQGINIVATVYDDGSVATRKIFIKDPVIFPANNLLQSR
ncbi:polysaccharide lyase family 1 protein [Saccharicrinis sp. FJH54]|uniref:pectate lyase family protein n=1 Tax=Saccharicrinis sp. FJH54 TaxID=3344665 RepID=UPI0035D44E36